MGGLVKKQIIDKRGRRTTVWVNPASKTTSTDKGSDQSGAKGALLKQHGDKMSADHKNVLESPKSKMYAKDGKMHVYEGDRKLFSFKPSDLSSKPPKQGDARINRKKQEANSDETLSRKETKRVVDEAKSNKPSKHAQELSEELGGKDRKKIAGNTYAIKDGGDIHVKLYDTNVVTHKSDGSIKLDSGGFMTKTTKSRINDFSDAQVYQKKGDWFVDYKGKTHDFKDGMTLK